MRKTIFCLFITIIMPKITNAYQIASNHSYIKNSEFTTNYDINIKGYGDFKFIYNESKDKNNLKNSITNSENEISININLNAELNEISKYGLNFIQTFNNNFKKENEYYGYLHGYYGKLEFGNTLSTAENMRIGADTVALGSGGIGSNFIRYIKLANNGNYNPTYMLSPGTLTSQNFGYYNSSIKYDFWDNSKYLTKINYYSPELYGFQFGLGIIPNVKLKSDNVGEINNKIITSDINIGTFINYGLNYINTFDTVGIAVSIVGEQNISNPLNKENNVKEKINNKFNSLEFGFNVNYFGLTLALSKGTTERNIKSDTTLASMTEKKGEYTTYGLSYELNEFSVSATFFESEYKNYTKFNSSAFAIENKMSKNISIYAEYINFKSKFIKASVEEKGYNILAGILLNFN